MGLFGLNLESICLGDKNCIAQRDSKLSAAQANTNALNAIAAKAGTKDYTPIIIISIISFVVLVIVGSLLYLKTKHEI